jgi:hypothetical protein
MVSKQLRPDPACKMWALVELGLYTAGLGPGLAGLAQKTRPARAGAFGFMK